MISFKDVSIRYRDDSPEVLRGVNLEIPDGQLVLVAGRTGSGKSTLLGAINGHVPHFTGGFVSGKVEVEGYSTALYRPRDLAHVVGVVGQDPLAGFVTDTVEEELAYTMEQLGVDPMVMRTRVEETLDILGLAGERNRALSTLSGGQQQRVAIGSVLATGVRVLVLDEPTSALDPVSSEEVLAALLRLVHDLGLTVMVAEHRLERVAGYADQMILVEKGLVTADGTAAMMTTSQLIPPVVELGRVAGFPQVPLSVRQARGMAGELTTALAGIDPAGFARVPPAQGKSSVRVAQGVKAEIEPTSSQVVVSKMTVAYPNIVAVNSVSLTMPSAQISVIMGRNGSGKSSLLWALTGVQPITAGRFSVGEVALEGLASSQVRRYIRLVPHHANDLLFLPSVAEECATADRDADEEGLCQRILEALAPRIDLTSHPSDLSQGQKLALVLAIQLTASPQVILLDEPTRGLDYPAKATLAQILKEMAMEGRSVGLVTHDVEFAAEVADQILVMASGDIIAAGSPTQVLGSSALFAPQVAKVLYPEPWLTPYQVAQALKGRNTSTPAGES
ncbi:MAG: ATP-binding cassette domain-containing protein [Propionibacteriaceae bacterium]|nr:ATP-binding cassette domain-containing protein [Propionibacteriaceae bacterium]